MPVSCYHSRLHLANVFKCVAVRILLQRWKQTIMAWDQIRVTFVCDVLRILYVMKWHPRTRKGSLTIYQNIYRVPGTHFLIEYLYPGCSSPLLFTFYVIELWTLCIWPALKCHWLLRSTNLNHCVYLSTSSPFLVLKIKVKFFVRVFPFCSNELVFSQPLWTAEKGLWVRWCFW